MSMAIGGSDSNTIADINVTPMVDIMLVLLIIFMVITPLLQKGVSVDLAKTKNPREMREADRDDAVVVAITRDAKIWLGADQMTKDQLGTKIRDVLVSKVDKTVYVKSDRRARYGEVVDVVDIVRTAGVDTLGLLTTRVEGQGGEQ
ncbi:MAG: biopolymer transporter ExbD [Acidimicrobiia bacterium]|nr:biopolymer transporter ExbD [Acidimicrobiia bacterium]